MPIDLSELVAPSRTAVVTSEIQGGVVGEGAALPALAEAFRAGPLANVARLCEGARQAGAAVVHCTFERRPDGRGANANARLFAAMARNPVQLTAGTPAVAVVPEVGVDPADLVLVRHHGVGPMGGTDLDAVLRNLGVATIVAVGVSVNVALLSLAMDAVNAGYQVVVPRDAVAGVPADYAEAVLDQTMSLLATLVSTDDVLAAWS